MKRLLCLLAFTLLLVGCAGEKGIVDKDGYQLDIHRQVQAAYPHIEALVIYCTADDLDPSLATSVGKNISSHYLIPAVPSLYYGRLRIWQLVPEKGLVWRAGISFRHGAVYINDISTGIELENRSQQRLAGSKYFALFGPAQIQALAPLAKDIIARYDVEPQNVATRADITPQRKDDPGPLFPRRALAVQDIGAWLDTQRTVFYLIERASHTPIETAPLFDLLSCYDYEIKPGMAPYEQQRMITAFQMHSHLTLQNGVVDAEAQAIAGASLEKYGQG